MGTKTIVGDPLAPTAARCCSKHAASGHLLPGPLARLAEQEAEAKYPRLENLTLHLVYRDQFLRGVKGQPLSVESREMNSGELAKAALDGFDAGTAARLFDGHAEEAPRCRHCREPLRGTPIHGGFCSTAHRDAFYIIEPLDAGSAAFFNGEVRHG
jgi:hypothetical protein